MSGKGGGESPPRGEIVPPPPRRGAIDWDRSYLDYYGPTDRRCTRFDEHSSFGPLSRVLPPDCLHKALPGWIALSRLHADDVLSLPRRMGGIDLWPAFDGVWAPEETYFPTALALAGHIPSDRVVSRPLTYSEWDHRAKNEKERAHPRSFDYEFDERLVKRMRDEESCLFLRKLKRRLDVKDWENAVLGYAPDPSKSSDHQYKGEDWHRKRAREGDSESYQERSKDSRQRREGYCRLRSGENITMIEIRTRMIE